MDQFPILLITLVTSLQAMEGTKDGGDLKMAFRGSARRVGWFYCVQPPDRELGFRGDKCSSDPE